MAAPPGYGTPMVPPSYNQPRHYGGQTNFSAGAPPAYNQAAPAPAYSYGQPNAGAYYTGGGGGGPVGIPGGAHPSPMPQRGMLERTQSADDLNVEMKLGETREERERYDDMAEMFALFKAVEYLEKAYLRDVIATDVYAPECTKLLNKFKIMAKNMEKTVGNPFAFAEQYRAASSAAIERLKAGVPANVDSESGTVAVAAEATHHFITAMDSLKMDMRAVDEIRPSIGDIVGSLNRMSTLPSDFAGREKMRNWLQILDRMAASDSLDDSQIRQLSYDIESAYSSFHEFLKGKH
uniref:Vacuolar protein sorting-associated protein 28 homolog n=3 Tax=Palpitomonas bilix TaxID=652834 RepID=A0A7S3GKT3_9EUKA|mmetsp:Transcript_7595/g.19658  ORF Transcript_7595/g.19658 Transcript_7595/m.19658 type:complete len:293 (+) Transcript_7595:169-1047(+)|eukprot:CAMPEP_0113899312 /NCGR_PEP_ID=MMETSP0780_2-20120614/19944_1 /TAXON_ID=652834 /ORGANISM="Palpitomonas bilix" /LENGTH=292 /DNA_ID=CAMNT_0000891431 /DNA_START=162 /DNA_END=1040 /DNA_ORIENTATION=- /assembly_acc=CAM_ASM_000599